MAGSNRPGPGLMITLGLLALAAVWFYNGQNAAGHVGGAISLPKIFWLYYAISIFFVLPAFLWRDQRLDPTLRFIYACQFINWMIRGAAELWLMYGIHAWIPPYGMYHGIFTVALLMTLRYRRRGLLVTATTPVDHNAKRFLTFSMLSGGCEIVFAWLFYRAANFDTATTWFANGSASFVFINRLTTVVDIVVYTWLALTVYRYYRPAAPAPVLAR